MVGQKRLIYAIDAADKSKESLRELTKNFFKDELDFKESEIQFVDRTHFYKDQAGVWQTKFSDEEQKRLNYSAMVMFGDE